MITSMIHNYSSLLEITFMAEAIFHSRFDSLFTIIFRYNYDQNNEDNNLFPIAVAIGPSIRRRTVAPPPIKNGRRRR